MAVIADDVTQEVEDVFKAFKLCVGAIGPFQAIICSDPSPEYMAAMFEFNVETFYAREAWGPEIAAHSRFIRESMEDPESSEGKAIELSRTIRSGDQTKIEALQNALKEASDYDSLAAYSFGKSLEASGKYSEAIDAYRKSSGMNKMFHASTMSLGENLIVTGKLDEAQELYEKLEKTNNRNADRKLGLATIHTEKGDFTKAKSYLKDAAKIAPGSEKINETKAHMYLKAGKIGEAFKLMDNMSDVGPFFAAKLNEMGIKLSQAGKGKSALALYQKAHKVVRAELKFKISMNAALACYRLGLFQKSLAFLDRCEKEFGNSYEKLEKVRRAVTAALKKTKNKKAA